MLAHTMAFVLEHLVYSRTAVGAMAFGMDRTDLGGKRLVLTLSF